MEFQDKNLTCSECNAQFVFTAGEQTFFEEKGFGHEPKRCKDCRGRRKNEGGGGGGSSRHESAPRGGGAGRSSGEHFSATCSACGGPARLSFNPSPDRPVFCRTCYQARSGTGGNR
jgi:CxxC-x17-CxxC domain-containing protein